MPHNKASMKVQKYPVPTVAGDELKLRLGVSDSYLTGSERLGGIVEHNPLTGAGHKVMTSMRRRHGKRAKEVFYRSINAGVKGSSRWHE